MTRPKRIKKHDSVKHLRVFLLFLSNPFGALQTQIFYCLRPKQWVKNGFIFMPLIFGKQLFVYPTNLRTLIAFFLFSLAAGVVYMINDILDIKRDRVHPQKKLRPIASGKVTLPQAWVAVILLGAGACSGAFALNINFGWIIVLYLALNFLYSVVLKTMVILDVFCIGAFFLLRVVAGSVVTGVEISHWIIIMTTLLALFLGFSKRRQELKLLKRKGIAHRSVLAQYNVYFIDQMLALVTASIAASYMLYTVDARTVKEFGSNHLLATVPFVYYGMFRYLYLMHKRGKEGDPTRVLLSDRNMQGSLVLWMATCILVIYFHF